MVTPQQLTGQWVYNILRNYFEEQSKESSEKLFLKVTGLTDENIEAVLDQLDSNYLELEKYFNPVIRTVAPVDGFSQYSYKDHETSIWLRNNTNSGEALLLIINNITSEAQSLENLFALDESILLNEIGMSNLYYLMQTDYQIAQEEIDILKTFLSMYKKVSEPQLKSLTHFITSILNDDQASMVNRIQSNLPDLNCFVDSGLQINQKQLKRLKSNYLLAHLQKSSGSSFDLEKLQDKFYSFLENEEKNNWPHEIWGITTVSELRDQVFQFINAENDSLLQFEYDMINRIFEFKPKKRSVGEKLRTHFEENKDLTREEKNEVEQVVQALDYDNDADLVEDFIDEQHSFLESDGQLLKSLKRYVEKQRHSSEYTDLLDGLFQETYGLIEDNLDGEKVGDPEDYIFDIEVADKNLDASTMELLNFYLNDINTKIPNMNYNSSDGDQAGKGDEQVTLRLKLLRNVNGERKKIDDALLTINGINNNTATQFFELVSGENVPYIKKHLEEDLVVEDLVGYIQEEISPTLNKFEEKTVNAYEGFMSFLRTYAGHLKAIKDRGIYAISFDSLQNSLQQVMDDIYSDVSNVKNIYTYLDLIGVHDYFEEKPSKYIKPVERIVTVWNPIRLISYVKKTEEMGMEIRNWIEESLNDELQVQQREEFLNFSTEKYHKLAPRYLNRGDDTHYFIETFEEMGNGLFTLDNTRSSYSLNDTREIAKEVVNVTKNYFEVFPYAKDGMDILFLHVEDPNIITQSIKNLFSSKLGITKLKITAHSTNAAILHQQINSWIEHNEEYVLPSYENKFPKVEVNVINGESVTKIEQELNEHMVDADLVVLADYFSKSGQIEFEFSRTQPVISESWFNKPSLEPLQEAEAKKRLPLESSFLPQVLIDFYHMQYIERSGDIPEKDEFYILNQSISASNFNDGSLIDFMHENYNWNMIMDRFLDRSLLKKSSKKAQIIHYKPQAGTDKQFKLLVSSSESIKKLNTARNETEYYGRLERKLKQLLRVKQISSNNEVEQTVNTVKDISGSLVLRALGPGKFAHELMATSMYIRENIGDGDTLQVVSLCDELPWFSRNRATKRRPDLVVTTIYKQDGKLKIDFTLVELKFIRESLVDREKLDAIKQVETGMRLYEDLFSFEHDSADSEFWKEEFVDYLVETKAYNPYEVDLIHEFQHSDMEKIETSINAKVNIYCYDSFLEKYTDKLDESGMFTEQADENVSMNIFNRKYVLDRFGVIESESKVDYEELAPAEEITPPNGDDEWDDNIGNSDSGSPPDDKGEKADDNGEEENGGNDKEEKQPDVNPPDPIGGGDEIPPEERALRDLDLNRHNEDEDLELLVHEYERTIVRNFNQNNIPVGVQETVVGSSVIRMYLKLPSNIHPPTIEKKTQSLQLWLGLDTPPTVGIHNRGLYIDINRQTPSIVYFDEFMKNVRASFDKDISKKLVVPMGIDPLNNVLSFDLVDSMTPHLLVGGTTGSGKSVTLNSIIISLMLLYPKDHVRFTFIDPKKVEFAKYETIPYTDEVLYDLEKSVDRLEELCDEMDERYTQMQREFLSDIKDYNEQVADSDKLPHKVIVFDEFADFQSQDQKLAKRVEEAIKRLGQKGRAAGMHLIICTQNPKAEVINTTIRSNLPARLALRVTDGSSSKIILDETGAEKLAGKGDFLLKGGTSSMIRGKSPFLEPRVQSAIFKYLAKQ